MFRTQTFSRTGEALGSLGNGWYVALDGYRLLYHRYLNYRRILIVLLQIKQRFVFNPKLNRNIINIFELQNNNWFRNQ